VGRRSCPFGGVADPHRDTGAFVGQSAGQLLMKTAVLAANLLFVAFLIHWILWRVRIPRRQTAALLIIFLGTLPIGLVAVVFLPALKGLGPLGLWPCLHVVIFQVAMSLAYVVAYSAIEERSPSMTLVLHVADAGPKGRSREELMAVLKEALPVECRLDALVRDGMVVESQGLYRLTGKGRAWARLFSWWRRALRIGKGG